jgi:hypothetical protein
MVTGYYYSIRGDLYLQRTWNRLKASLSQSEKPLALPAPELVSAEKKKVQRKVKTPAKTAKEKQAKTNVKTKVNAKKEVPKIKVAEKVKVSKLIEQKKIPENAPIKTTKTRKRIRTTYSPMQQENPTGSVSDRLQKLSGRSYDVYQDRFLTKARAAIRKMLGSGKGLFYVIPEDIEDLLYNFLRDHYSDPYMNWEKSDEKKQLESNGFSLNSLDSIIEECYKKLS